MGPVCRPAYVCRSCICNAHNALCNRHAKKRPEFTHSFDLAVAWFTKHQQALQYQYAEAGMEWTDERWIHKWSASKQLQIIRSRLFDSYRPGDVDFMVKREVYPEPKDKARGIQMYSNLRTQASYAPRITAVQKAVAKVFSPTAVEVDGVRFIFSSGLNNLELGQWMDSVVSRGFKFFYERDGKSWDATMGPAHQELKETVVGLVDREVSSFLRECYHTRGRFIGRGGRRLVYNVAGTTKSGHNDTSLGNSIINAAIALEAVFDAKRVCPDLRADILVMGDDLLVAFSERVDVDRLIEVESACGIVPEARGFDDPEDVSFISGLFVPTLNGFRFCSKPGSLLSKLFWSCKPPSWRKAQAYRNGVVVGLLPTYAEWPIVGKFLRSQLRGMDRFVDRKLQIWLDDLTPIPFDSQVAQWFSRRYRLDPALVANAEEMLGSLCPGPCYLVDPALETIILRDSQELCDRDLARL